MIRMECGIGVDSWMRGVDATMASSNNLALRCLMTDG